METCPKCGAHFFANDAWANRGVLRSLLTPGWQELDTHVRCPGCGQVFPASAFRYFAILSPRGMKILIGPICGGLVFTAIYAFLVESTHR
jgi:hypothetical protein